MSTKHFFAAAVAATAITAGAVAAFAATGTSSTTAPAPTPAISDTTPETTHVPETTDTDVTITTPATGQPSDMEPADEVDETSAPDAAGIVGGAGAATDEPTDEPAPWAPVALDAVEGDAPEPTPLPEENVLDTTPAPSGQPGGLTSNAPGCASTCLVRAALLPSRFTPDMGFETRTNVEARIHVWLSKNTPLVVDGVPAFATTPPVAMSDGFVTEWGATLDLDADATYNIVVRATDRQGEVQLAVHQFHTLAPVDDLAAGEDSCVFECIREATVAATDLFSAVAMHVETNVPATLAVYVSTQEPGWIGDSPFLPAQDQIEVQGDLRQSWDLGVTGLAGDTTYHVVVKATDADGHTASRIGEFHTAAEPPTDVRVTFETLFVLWDGDATGVNKGEISFAWAVGGATLGLRTEDKLDGGTIIELDEHNQAWVSVQPGAFLPDVAASIAERDADLGGGQCTGGSGVPVQPYESEACDTKTNVGHAGPQTVDMIRELPRCSEFGFTGAKADDHCGTFITPDLGDDYARMQVVVSYRID